MTIDIDDLVSGFDQPMLKARGLDFAVIGIVERAGEDPFLLYDTNKVLANLVEEDGMTEEEAREYFEYNIMTAYAGDGTPGYIELVEDI